MFHFEREPVSPLRRRYIDDLRLRNKSPRTIETYVLRVVQFTRHFGKSPEQLGPLELRAYQQHLLSRQVSWSMFNQSVCALRFLYNVTLSRPHLIQHLPFAKRPRTIPTVLSPEEVVRLLEAALPGRDRTLLDLAYACGLRLKELVGLQVRDIDSARMVLHIRHGKGQKERVAPADSASRCSPLAPREGSGSWGKLPACLTKQLLAPHGRAPEVWGKLPACLTKQLLAPHGRASGLCIPL